MAFSFFHNGVLHNVQLFTDIGFWLHKTNIVKKTKTQPIAFLYEQKVLFL